MTSVSTRFQFRERYFFLLVLPVALAIEWSFAATLDWQVNPRSEWVALVDLCVLMPAAYVLFFSGGLSKKARLIRGLGVAGLGLLAARFIVPDANQFLIADLAQVRNALLGFVILFEGWVMYKILSAVYARNADAASLERDFAMPGWIARLMVLEARFWKAVIGLFRRK